VPHDLGTIRCTPIAVLRLSRDPSAPDLIYDARGADRSGLSRCCDLTEKVLKLRRRVQKLTALLRLQPTQPFIDANRAAISRCLAHEESGLRSVVNIPADALLGFLDAQRDMNAYNLPIVAGHARGPSAVRDRVDRLFGSYDPQNYFYGAASLGGIQVRAGQPTEGVCGVLV
jgi:hypothetical protein